MADDLTIEVTGSAEKANSALDKIIAKIGELQERFDKVAPSVSKFAAEMDKIASSSKAFSSFAKLTKSVDSQALASKNAESKMAMYQARLDRANTSMERSRVQSEKLAASLGKVSVAQKIAESNSAAFSMPTADFAAKYNHTSDYDTNTEPEYPQETDHVPTAVHAAFAQNMPAKTQTIHFDTSQAQTAVEQLGAFIDRLTPEISHMSAEAQAQFSALSSRLMVVGQQIDNQRAIYHNLAVESGKIAQSAGEGSTAYLQIEKKMLSAAAAADRLSATQDKLKAQLSDVASAAGKAGVGMAEAGAESERGSRRAQNGWYQTWNMFSKMMIRIAAFRIFSAIQQGITTGLQDMAQANSQANATMSALATNSLYLKNSLAAALMPVLQALIPVINQVTDALVNVFNTIGMLVGRIFNHATTAVIAKRANVNYAATLDKTGDSASNTAKKVKELQRTVMGFDELNVLQKQTSDTDSTPKTPKNSNPGMPAYGDMFETVKIPDWINKIGSWTDKIAGFIRDNANTINRLLWGVPLVVGAVLAFSGANIPLGIGLMAIGAIGMGKQAKEDWDYLANKTNSSLDKTKRLLIISGTVELAIGAILAFSGIAVGLGISLMAGGIATTATAVNWDSLSPNIKHVLGAFTFTSAVVMLALGTIFMATGHFGVGIGLLVDGATAMWGSATLNWGLMDAQLKEKVSEWTIIASGALFGLGAIMLATGHIGLGIGMLIAGAIGIVSAATLNWDSIKTKMTGKLGEITAKCSTFLLALGLMLVLTNVMLPLGIGMMVAGGAGLAAAVAINWNYIRDKIGEALEGVKGKWNEFKSGWSSWGPVKWWNSDVAPWFTWKKWHDLGQQALDAITAPFKNIHWPKISTPHLEWTSGGWQSTGWIYNVLNALHLPTQMPKLNVSWYAKGALFTKPVLGFGEAGPEAALPLNDRVFSQIADGIMRNGQSDGSGNLDTERIIQRMDKMQDAIEHLKVYIYGDDKKIAESANHGNRLLGKTAPTN